jgi:hypothetical protein
MLSIKLLKLMSAPLAARKASGGIWLALLSYVEGRSARLFERERRQTYQAVPHVLLPGTHVFDRRADGSILEITIPPAAQTGATIEAGNSAPPEVQASSAGEIPVRRAIAAPARSKA